MQTGVYGSGYLGTVVSACLADFGTPVTCCHPDSSRMVEMAQGNVPFFEKNLTEVIKRNVRSGRLAYSTDMESFARKAQVIFLAEDTPQHLADLAVRIARLAPKPPILTIMTPVSVGTATSVEKRLKDAGLKATIVSQPVFLTPGCAVEDFNWPDRIILGTVRQRCRAGAETDSPSPGDAGRSRDRHQSRNRGTGAGIGHGVRRDQDFFHQ